MDEQTYRQEAYRRGEGQVRGERRLKESVKARMEDWLKRKLEGQWIYPLTLEFKNGPWLYGEAEQIDYTQLEREIGIFIERLYRFGVKHKYRDKPGWSYLGWPDKGGRGGFIHYHGFLLIGSGHWMSHEDENGEPDFKGWFNAHVGRVYGHEATAVCYAHVSAEVQTITSIKTFNGYASKWGVVEPVWYQAGLKNTLTQTWVAGENTQSWTSGDFVILRGRRQGFRILHKGIDAGRTHTLHLAKKFCEARMS